MTQRLRRRSVATLGAWLALFAVVATLAVVIVSSHDARAFACKSGVPHDPLLTAAPPSPLPVTVPSGTPTTITLKGFNTAGDPVTFGFDVFPLHGTVSPITNLGGTNPTTATVIYTSSFGFQGPDAFDFNISQGLGFDCATVSIQVTLPPPPIPTPPAAPPPLPLRPVTSTTTPPTTMPPTTTSPATTLPTTTLPTTRPRPTPTTSGGGLFGFLGEPPHRSQFVSSVTPPNGLDTSAQHLAANFSLALLFVLLSWLPAEIINDVLKERHDQLAAQGNVVAHHFQRFQAWVHAWPTPLTFGIFAVVAAAIYGFLDPSFGLDTTSLVLLGAIWAALVIITLAHELIHGWHVQRRKHVPFRLETLPLGLVLAAVLVVFSRLAHFQPGYSFGLVCGVLFVGRVEDRDDGRSLAVATTATLALAVTAWLVWIPIQDAAVRSHPSVQVLFLDALFASVWVFALQTVVFSLVPLRFLAGAKVRQWSRAGWLALYVTGMFVFVEAVMHSSQRYGGSSKASVWSMLIIFLAFTGAAILIWAWFQLSQRWSRRPGSDEPVEVA